MAAEGVPWRHFQSAVCSNKELLQLVMSHLEREDQSNMRLANRRLCEAVSAAVTEVTYALQHGRLQADLSTLFPSASKLRLRIVPHATAGKVTARDMYVFVQHVVDQHPTLLRRLAHLVVDVALEGELRRNARTALSRLLARCTGLRGLDVILHDQDELLADKAPSRLHFNGQGSTPDQCLVSMQQQLRGLVSSAAFLGPTTWPAHGCLTKLDLICELGGFEVDFGTWCSSSVAVMSLAHLHILVPEAATLLQCRGMSRLSKLTHLALLAESSDTASPLHDLVSEVAPLTSLAELRMDNYVLGSSEECSIPSSWSQLARLTSLDLWDCHLQLDRMPSLSAVHELQLQGCTLVGSLGQLSSWQALTSLQTSSCTFQLRDEAAAAVEHVQMVGGAADMLRQSLRNLRELHWHGSWRELPTVVQCTQLTRLELLNADVGPELCWHLASLPKLQHLQLPDATAPAEPSAPTATAFRPRLHALTFLQPGSVDSMRELACWTDVSPGVSLSANCSALLLSVDNLGSGWLAALMASPTAQPLTLALRDDDAVQGLVRALQSLPASGKRAPLDLWLGQEVGQAPLKALFAAAAVLPDGRLHIANSPTSDRSAEVGYPLLMQLPPMWYCQLRGLQAPALRMLQIHACSTLQDLHMALIVSAAPGLCNLQLSHAASLTDAALYALLRCQELEHVCVTGCRSIGAPAVAALLVALSKLRYLRAGYADYSDVAAALAAVPASDAAPQALRQTWQLESVAGGSVLCTWQG